MPASPTRTKKALQELAKVFNKLASELTADLNAAINEIDSLKREVQRLKSGSGKTNKTSTPQKKTASSKTTRSHPTRGNQPGMTHPEGSHTSHESGHDTKPSDETGSFVFPHEPFNPSPPPEPTPPGNN
jgi:DNA anti-recombination protein RmuC